MGIKKFHHAGVEHSSEFFFMWSGSHMDATLSKIKALSTVNAEIIERLSRPDKQRVVAYKYYVEYKEQSFNVREEKEERAGENTVLL